MELVFATGNKNKVNEANLLLSGTGQFNILSLHEKGILEDIPETGNTLTENAIQKALYINNNYGFHCFSEDTGLEVEALNGEPGIYSARYAGPDRKDENNIQLVLDKLKDKKNRKARFRTVICLIIDNKQYLFEGITEGQINKSRSGTGGFGYDPIFTPEGHDKSFAQMSKEEKTAISHRGKAIRKLVEFLKQYKGIE